MRILLLIFSCCLMLKLSLAGTIGDRKYAILEYQSKKTNDGYYFQYKTSNGLKHEETGTVIKGNNNESSYLQVHGEFSYLAPDGKQHITKYKSGDEGYQPEINVKPQDLPLDRTKTPKPHAALESSNFDGQKHVDVKFQSAEEGNQPNLNVNSQESSSKPPVGTSTRPLLPQLPFPTYANYIGSAALVTLAGSGLG